MPHTPSGHPGSAWEVLVAFTRLGVTSFGGPVAHLGYFREEFVIRRRWLDEHAYADLVALCQFLPGPASSQVGFSLGLLRAGFPGALAAWIGFTLPSALLLVAFALLAYRIEGPAGMAALHGLKIVAVAIVGQAVWAMARSLCPDWPRALLAGAAAATLLLVPSPLTQIAVLLLGGIVGLRLLPTGTTPVPPSHLPRLVAHRTGVAALVLFVVLLAALPLLARHAPDGPLALFDAFYRSGALVFGGGHVVLPLLDEALVESGWVGREAFLAGYGAAQAVPGPLFTFAAYLGVIALPGASPLAGAAWGLAGIFLPGLLVLVGTLPFWESLRRQRAARGALAGVNAAVVGVLAAALCTPISSSAITTAGDAALALCGLLLLATGRARPLPVVLLTVAASVGLALT